MELFSLGESAGELLTERRGVVIFMRVRPFFVECLCVSDLGELLLEVWVLASKCSRCLWSDFGLYCVSSWSSFSLYFLSFRCDWSASI